MDKRVILDRLIEQLSAELAATRRASEDAASYATDEESKADSQWDTQGLEASYLARGQAGHAAALIDAVQTLKGDLTELIVPRRIGEVGALMGCTVAGEVDWYFLAPVAGGESIEVDGTTVTVITPGSPLFGSLRNRTRGERVHLPSGAVLTVTALE